LLVQVWVFLVPLPFRRIVYNVIINVIQFHIVADDAFKKNGSAKQVMAACSAPHECVLLSLI
jgi:hypothetical protein